MYRNNLKEVYGIYDFVMIDGEVIICIIFLFVDSNIYMVFLILIYVGISFLLFVFCLCFLCILFLGNCVFCWVLI